MLEGPASIGGTAIRSFPLLTLTFKHIRVLLPELQSRLGKFASPRDIPERWTGLTVGDGSRDMPFIARAFYLPELIDFVNCNTGV
jgi:hypothetical protein